MSKNRYMFLLRGGKSDRDQSPQDLQQTIAKYLQWIAKVRESGNYVAGEPLEENQSRVLSGSRGATVTDGPFIEGKDAVGGYFIILANDLEEASSIARGCPIFDNGGTLEVRAIAPVPSGGD